MIKGLYVHIPFCQSICGYCDFAKRKYNDQAADRYLDHLEKEVSLIDQAYFDSVYIGGGTPTALNHQQLQRLFFILSRFEVRKEYTIEINPETFDIEKAMLLKQYGVNRVSIGIQSFHEDLLCHMSRSHRNKDVKNTFHFLDEVGIRNRSIDLMYGFQNQTLKMLEEDLQTAVNMDITHISIYDLEIHEATLFGKRNYQHVDDETDFQMYQLIMEFLNAHGFQQYETSNFARTGYESSHNQLYWHYEDFIGVGMGASGKIGNVRYDNTRSWANYLKDQYRQEEYALTDDEVCFESIMMGLRLLEGICIEEYNRRYQVSLLEKYREPIQKNIDKKLLEINDGYLKTTSQGIFVLNDILVDFMD